MHSKKIGTVFSIGLIQRFLVRLMSRINLIGICAMRVKLFFDKADLAAAFHACESNLGKLVEVCVEAHVFLQIVG